MAENQLISLDGIKEQIKLKSPTQQIRYISSLTIPEEEEELIAFIAYMREGAQGNLSKFENVTNAYRRKYNEAFAKTENRKLSRNIENLEITQPKSAMLVRFIGITVVIVVGIFVIKVFSGHRNQYESFESISDYSNIKDVSDDQNKLAEHEEILKNAETETDRGNLEISDTDVSHVKGTTPSEPVELEFSGTVANSEVTMQLTVDFEGNRAWGTYRYAKGSGDIVLMGDINIIEADKYMIKYTTNLQEYDSSGNPGGIMELNCSYSDFFKEMTGKYISVKGKESKVLLSQN